MNITGLHIAYKIICVRKLWLFTHHIECEQDSDTVAEGRLLHDNTYKRQNKEILFGPILVDWIDLENKIVHEVKKSNRVEEAHIWQLKYYLYYLKNNNIGEFTGMLNYPKLNKTTTVSLSDDDIIRIKKMIGEIKVIVSAEFPPDVDKPITFCKKCSYYELCLI